MRDTLLHRLSVRGYNWFVGAGRAGTQLLGLTGIVPYGICVLGFLGVRDGGFSPNDVTRLLYFIFASL